MNQLLTHTHTHTHTYTHTLLQLLVLFVSSRLWTEGWTGDTEGSGYDYTPLEWPWMGRDRGTPLGSGSFQTFPSNSAISWERCLVLLTHSGLFSAFQTFCRTGNVSGRWWEGMQEGADRITSLF